MKKYYILFPFLACGLWGATPNIPNISDIEKQVKRDTKNLEKEKKLIDIKGIEKYAPVMGMIKAAEKFLLRILK